MKLFYVFSIDYQLISHRQAVVKAAISKGFEVTVVAQDTGYRQKIESMGCRFVDLPINRTGTNVLEELHTLKFLYDLYRWEKPDIVHHVSIKLTLWGGLAARLAKVPAVVNAVNGLGVFFESGKIDSVVKRIFMCIIRFSNKHHNTVTIFQNTDDKRFFVENGGIEEAKCRMISGSGVDLQDFSYSEGPESTPLKIVFTSRMVEEKGVLDIIAAAKTLKPKYNGKIRFLLCGLIETSPTAISEDTLLQECDTDYICYLGQRSDIKNILKESAIVVLPSYYREGIPKSLIEACATGRPIITTDWVGCKEAVVDGENGYLIPIKSPQILAEKIETLINDTSLRSRMGKASRTLAEKRFSINDVIVSHLAIYNELLNL